MNYEQFLEQMKQEHGEALKDMPLPPGVADHVRKMAAQNDPETLLFMIKLAWVFGVQYGQASAQHGTQNNPTPSPIQA